MRCGPDDRHIAPAAGRPRISVRAPTRLPFPRLDLLSREYPAVFASHPASGYIPASPVVVDTFGFSAPASVRPAIVSLRILRYPRISGHRLLLLHHWLCSTLRQMPERLSGTPCRTEHRNESRAIPSLFRVTPSATSEYLRGLLDSSSIPHPLSLLTFPFN